MIVDQNIINIIVELIKNALIDQESASRIVEYLIFEIGWDRINVLEEDDGDIVFKLSAIEEVMNCDGNIEEIAELLNG